MTYLVVLGERTWWPPERTGRRHRCCKPPRGAVTLCLAALDAAGAGRRVAELLTEAALFAEDRGKALVGLVDCSTSSEPRS